MTDGFLFCSQLDAAPALIANATAVGVDLAPAPRWPMYAFLAGAIACLGMSTACHTLANVTERVSAVVWRLDYVGIAGLIVASFFPVVYYSFMCMPCLLYTSPSPRDLSTSRMPSSA